MELRDYGTALRRYWRTWVGLTLAGVLAALAVVLAAPPTYQATAEVFVASASTGQSGYQFVAQRVTSYPDLASSRGVLEPVIQQLGLRESFAALASRVSAVNPAGTSQIQITVSNPNAQQAAVLANAVANRFRTVVEALEKPAGGPSPVNLTVTTPATAPSTPAFPVPSLLLTIGVVLGLLLGLAAAVIRQHRDTRLYTSGDVRAAWGPDGGELTVHAPARRSRRSRRGPLASRPATLLARSLEPLAEKERVRVVVLSPTQDQRAARSFLTDLEAQLQGWSVPVRRVEAETSDPRPPQRNGVELVPGTPSASMREWRNLADAGTGIVVVVAPGRVDGADLREVRSIFATAGVRLLAVVLHSRRGMKKASDAVPTAAESARPALLEGRPEIPAAVGRG